MKRIKHATLVSLIAAFATVALPVAGAEPPAGAAPAAEAEAEMEVVEIAINAPATNYGISIVEIRKVGGELWVLSKVKMVGEIGGAAITEVKDAVEIPKQGLPMKHFVAGKTWGWADPETVTYLPGETITDEKWAKGAPVWKREGAEPKGARAGVPTFEEWVKGGKKIPEDRVFIGGSPWFDESKGARRSPEEVYQMLYGGRER